jgi:predicted DNA-binding protein with PD1-like motif
MESTEIVSLSDRLKLSDRELTHLFAAFAKANGDDFRTSTFFYASVRRCRETLRNSLFIVVHKCNTDIINVFFW